MAAGTETLADVLNGPVPCNAGDSKTQPTPNDIVRELNVLAADIADEVSRADRALSRMRDSFGTMPPSAAQNGLRSVR